MNKGLSCHVNVSSHWWCSGGKEVRIRHRIKPQSSDPARAGNGWGWNFKGEWQCNVKRNRSYLGDSSSILFLPNSQLYIQRAFMPFVLHPRWHIQCWPHKQVTKASDLDLDFKDIGLPPGKEPAGSRWECPVIPHDPPLGPALSILAQVAQAPSRPCMLFSLSLTLKMNYTAGMCTTQGWPRGHFLWPWW